MSVFRVRKKVWEFVVLEAERRKKSSSLFSSQRRTKARKLEGSVSFGRSSQVLLGLEDSRFPLSGCSHRS